MTNAINVAALYVDPRGPYPKLLGPEYCWDEARDARTYAGPWPVVAHPPCGPWGQLRHLYKGDQSDCAIRAVEQVRRFGGVLEHPAGSQLWRHCGLPRPGGFLDEDGNFTLEVEQCAWGHPARKRTWLFLVGVPLPRGWSAKGAPTHWVSGGRNPNRKGGRRGGGIVPPGIKVCSAQQRRRTPIAFAEWLITLARTAEASGRAA